MIKGYLILYKRKLPKYTIKMRSKCVFVYQFLMHDSHFKGWSGILFQLLCNISNPKYDSLLCCDKAGTLVGSLSLTTTKIWVLDFIIVGAVLCTLGCFSGIPNLYPLDASSTYTPVVTPKTSQNSAKCPLEGKITLCGESVY